MEFSWYKSALFNGFDSNAVKLGTVLTGGWFWVRTDGCSLLYRGQTISNIDFDRILDAYDISAQQITAPQWITYFGGDRFVYVLSRANGIGTCDKGYKAAIIVEIDSFGQLSKNRCNSVFEISAMPVSDFKVKLQWCYFSWHQGSQPLCFRIYTDNGTGQIDYGQAIDEVEYDGRRFYSYISDSLSIGRYKFEVKAANSDFLESEGFARADIEIRGKSPATLIIAGIERV